LATTPSSVAAPPRFNRGSGDPEHGPNPSLAPLEKAPFYAIEVRPGSFGTFAGLKADPQSRVLDKAGRPIPGLYVAGSDQANVMGGHYPSGGINIGPAMTFGYLAARHAAGVQQRQFGLSVRWSRSVAPGPFGNGPSRMARSA
jgi:succinate dehydrogenase/fumarate reductase flavoprotein subunit